MGHNSSSSAAWFRALTLAERLALVRTPGEVVPDAEARREVGARRLQRWRSEPPFTDRSRFARRLEMDGLNESDLLELLGEPAAALRERCGASMPWVAKLASAFSRAGEPSRPGSDTPGTDPSASFLSLVTPLLSDAVERLREQLEVLVHSMEELPFDPTTVVQVCASPMLPSLVMILSRMLALELNVARLEGKLSGETPQERFQSFARRLSQPEVALTLLEEYPVLARQVMTVLDRWVTVSGEFLRRLCDDWAAIRGEFMKGGDPGPLLELGGAGDTHRGGRCVMIASFRSGFRLVYKPKSLAADLHFQELLTWLNDRGATPPFRTLRLLDRRTYGWAEHVGRIACTSTEMVERFYERLGGYLALFYALEATDFHAENLLAVGEHPVPVDLEALFHARLKTGDRLQMDPASEALNHSVMRVGLLPERTWATADSPGVDMSGMGSAEGQLTPFQVPLWKNDATDTMQLVRERIPVDGSENRPTLNGEGVSLLSHVDAVEAGFRRTYQLLLRRREELLAEDGPIVRFANDEVRFIPRMTQTYTALLRESYHPDVLRDALDRDRLLDRLWQSVEREPHLERLIPAEREDILQGDIPMFTTQPRSRDLATSGGKRIPDFFSVSGLAQVEEKLGGLSESDMDRQLWIIRASLATVASGVESVQGRADASRDPSRAVDRDRLLAAARKVGDRLDTLAIRRGSETSWLGLGLVRERHWSVTPLGIDLYDGLPGVALFLANLASLTDDERYSRLARGALSALRMQIPQMKSYPFVGAFSGWGGVLYTLTHLAVLWREPALLDEAEQIIDSLPERIAKDEQFDIIGGAAGCLGTLLALHRVRPSAKTLATAIGCGDRLLNRAEPQPEGQGQGIPTIGTRRPLSGFSHGAAGMAWALLHLAAVSREVRFRDTALEMIRHERTLFFRDAENWLDLREWVNLGKQPGESPPCQTFWCHGAPGIGLGRLRSLPYLDDPAVHDEIAVAVRTTVRSGFGFNDSLCHGDFGNLDFLLQASRSSEHGTLRDDIARITSGILASIDTHGWHCGNPLNVESPGLMTGLAGVGYGLLRLADPDRVPSVLSLEPPETAAVGGDCGG